MPDTQQRFAILGTAGHIDHGKTALVRLLTGRDTDRLKEEKERGISIDLGFAHLDLPGGISCGIVDVPGHERFVKNMLAGACGMDAMMMVIAADEGVMPQTREHLDILDLLDVRTGIVALTKTDMVEPDWLDLVTETVREYLAERGFGAFPIVPVSSKTGEGKDAVIAALAGALDSLEERPSHAALRLPVDRAFVVEGFGSVVTGTLWQGRIRPGDTVMIEPGGIQTRARKVEVHGVEVSEAHSGQRTAVALAGVSLDQVPRGTWLVAPESLHPAHMLDVRLRVLPESARPVKHRQRIRFHLGATEALGRIVPLEVQELEPGQDGLAQVRLEVPVVAARGDRFVLRSYSPARAIAGGTVILPDAPKRRRNSATLDELTREETGSPEDRLLAAIEAVPWGEPEPDRVRRSGLPPEVATQALGSLVAEGRVVEIGGRALARQTLDQLSRDVTATLARFHEEYPLRWGANRGDLKSLLGKSLPAPVFEATVDSLSRNGDISIDADHIRLGDSQLELPEALAQQVERVAEALATGGMSPPTVKELAALLGFAPGETLEHLTFVGRAVKLTPDLFWDRARFQELRDWIKARFETHEALSVADLREAWEMSRKYSVPALEYLDREGWTRRDGDVRVPGRRLGDSDS